MGERAEELGAGVLPGRSAVGLPFPKATVEKGCSTKALTKGKRPFRQCCQLNPLLPTGDTTLAASQH